VPVFAGSAASTVTTVVVWQEDGLVVLYVIVEVPDETGFISPVPLFAVATPGVLLVHAPPDVEFDSDAVWPMQ
jgi:hypothetical protein